MKKSELTAWTEKLDRMIANTPETDPRWPLLVNARLLAEQTLMLATLLASVQSVPTQFEQTRAEVVSAIVQRTWPGIIKFDDPEDGDVGKPPAEEEEDE